MGPSDKYCYWGLFTFQAKSLVVQENFQRNIKLHFKFILLIKTNLYLCRSLTLGVVLRRVGAEHKGLVRNEKIKDHRSRGIAQQATDPRQEQQSKKVKGSRDSIKGGASRGSCPFARSIAH